MANPARGHDEIEVAALVVGEVTTSFVDCVRSDRETDLDVARARAQHRDYVAAVAAVAEVQRVTVAQHHADAVFVEDTLVVLASDHALITRPGTGSRQGEVAAVAGLLAERFELEWMVAPATLDGGDVLRVRDHLFIGRSTRTNAAGARVLARLAGAHGLVGAEVKVPRGLHLKSACSLVDAETLIYDPGAGIDVAGFGAAGLECIAAPEPPGANVLALGGGQVLVSAAAPRTAEMLSDRGLLVTLLAMSELHKADGALTCCSIRLPAPGGWCT